MQTGKTNEARDRGERISPPQKSRLAVGRDATELAAGSTASYPRHLRESGKWFAVQVSTGQEERACELIEEADTVSAVDEVFVPRTIVGKYDKERGAWLQVERVMFPGYLMIVTRDAAALESLLARVRTFARVLGDQSGAVRLPEDEIALIKAYTKRGSRAFPASEGYITETGRIVVTEGPLVGQEVLIVKVKHRQKRAVIRMKFCNREKETEVGLHLVRGRNAKRMLSDHDEAIAHSAIAGE